MNPSSDMRQNAHAVIIGINKYQDQKIPNLNFARADAEGVYQISTDPELGRIPPDNVILLLDENATERKIRTAIGTDIPNRTSGQDMVFIYYAGHGSPVINRKSRSADGMEKYLVPVDAQLDNLRATGISMDDMQKFFGYIESKQVIFFIDSCYSGEAGGRTFQNPLYQKRAALTNEFLDDLAGEGRMVVTACDVNEVSLEAKNLGHGLFTHYLIEGLKGVADKDQDGMVTIHELYVYVYEQVSQHARKLGGSMHPIQKGSIKGKIFLTRYETAAQKQAKSLHDQAQAFYKAGKLGEAYEFWHQVIKFVPDHAGAKHGMAEIENWRKEEERKKQEILERKQRFLQNLYLEGQLPSEKYDVALALIKKHPNDLTVIERETRRLLDELIDKKISAASYVKNVRLLRKPAGPKLEPTVKKSAPAEPKIEPEKIPKPSVEKAAPIAPKLEPAKALIRRWKRVLPAARGNRMIAVAATLALIGLVIIWMNLRQSGKSEQVEQPPISTEKGTPSIHLRTTAIHDLSEVQVKAMLVEKHFYDSDWNKDGKGITHNYVEQTLNGDKVVIDKTTGLMWQQSGSSNLITYADAEKYILDLNNKPFAGLTGWRLPTLEEAMSLMEPQIFGNLYIKPIFDQKQWGTWTADFKSAGVTWVVNFINGYCFIIYVDSNDRYVRAVRSGQ